MVFLQFDCGIGDEGVKAGKSSCSFSEGKDGVVGGEVEGPNGDCGVRCYGSGFVYGGDCCFAFLRIAAGEDDVRGVEADADVVLVV